LQTVPHSGLEGPFPIDAEGAFGADEIEIDGMDKIIVTYKARLS
jgi:hypothetical protein